MRIDVLNSRVVDAPPERLAPLLDGLGAPGDRLWPVRQWPKAIMSLQRPLRPGSRGSHGGLTYSVTGYEPGRRLDFASEPGNGLHGTFSVAVDGPPGGPSTVSVPMAVEVAPRLRPIAPLVRVVHHAVVEDLLDNAERAATGSVARPRRAPAWLRALTGAELLLGGGVDGHGEGLGRAGAVGAPAVLLALAGVHAGWALGWRWPGTDDRSWADRVIGADVPPPSAAACWTVAAGLTAAAGAVASAASGRGGRPARLAGRLVAAAFAARGAAGPVDSLARGLDSPYRRLDVALYSPLCLAIAAGTFAAVARGARRPH
ncbi:uncharacterized protein DUF3995 [Kineococcus xinjiangensis]|uniref:Uncharacterized protein DUF3995 n=1 Tax=Kineococcus xinjiangensis TaxID=512762 RepID=A0A2S6IIS1_9ACTN|nr:DUF3995 domain-containing protein [Kineococcus xinjiangensis]PPK94124.1 uncharacterized protein DUF3995 [Kineococcus xinjiangensis]